MLTDYFNFFKLNDSAIARLQHPCNYASTNNSQLFAYRPARSINPLRKTQHTQQALAGVYAMINCIYGKLS
ncbi:MAG: hypothetical protein RLZZ135_262 [Cyanobacteriota bacterium]|jgi:hypothetical protein